jgi:urea transport system substrate-binding protein
MEATYIGANLWINAARSSGGTDIASIKRLLEVDTLAAPEGIVAVDGPLRHLWKLVRIGQARTDGQFDIVWESGRSMAPAPFPFFMPYAERRSIAGAAP